MIVPAPIAHWHSPADEETRVRMLLSLLLLLLLTLSRYRTARLASVFGFALFGYVVA